MMVVGGGGLWEGMKGRGRECRQRRLRKLWSRGVRKRRVVRHAVRQLEWWQHDTEISGW